MIDSVIALEAEFTNFKELIESMDSVCWLEQLLLNPSREDINIFGAPDGQAKLEFVVGYIASRPYVKSSEKSQEEINKKIDELISITNKYFFLMGQYLIINSQDADFLSSQLKMWSLSVRGSEYAQQFISFAEEMYSVHDEFFNKKIGFGLKQATYIWLKLFEYYEMVLKCFYLGQSSGDDFLFDLDLLMEISGFERKVCEAYLARLSQPFGYRNNFFLPPYETALNAPWDYNTLYERPIIRHGDKYILPIPAMMPEVLFKTFMYDILGDKKYKGEGSNRHGSWIEAKTAALFARILPGASISLNLVKENGEELCDVLIRYENKVIIVQCKAKSLQYESWVGRDIEKLKLDFKNGVFFAIGQLVNANMHQTATSESGDGLIYYHLVITLNTYQGLVTGLSNLQEFKDKLSLLENLWVISLFDLDILAKKFENEPALFFAYVGDRLKAGKSGHNFIHADEIDLLAYHLENGHLDFPVAAGVSIAPEYTKMHIDPLFSSDAFFEQKLDYEL